MCLAAACHLKEALLALHRHGRLHRHAPDPPELSFVERAVVRCSPGGRAGSTWAAGRRTSSRCRRFTAYTSRPATSGVSAAGWMDVVGGAAKGRRWTPCPSQRRASIFLSLARLANRTRTGVRRSGGRGGAGMHTGLSGRPQARHGTCRCPATLVLQVRAPVRAEVKGAARRRWRLAHSRERLDGASAEMLKNLPCDFGTSPQRGDPRMVPEDPLVEDGATDQHAAAEDPSTSRP